MSRLDGATGNNGAAATALRFDDGGMQLALGTSAGAVVLFDLRSSRPLLTKDHMYDLKCVPARAPRSGPRRAIRSQPPAEPVSATNPGSWT